MMKLLSFIVTVYNQEEYISECLHSLLPLSDVADIIVIDDGSYDNSFQIVKQIQDENLSIYAFQQKNEGVSIARNNALSFVQTQYVSFVDGDDCIEFADEKVLDILTNILNEGWDIIQYPILFNWKSQYERLKSSSQEIYGAKEYLKSYINGNLSYSCCNKIFKKELLNAQLFPAGRRYEDVCLLISLVDIIDKVRIIPYGKYLYRSNAISFSLKSTTYEKVSDFIYMAELWKKKICQYSLSKYWYIWLKVYILIEFARFQSDISILHLISPFSLCRKECIVNIIKPMPLRNRLFLLVNILFGSTNSVLFFSYLYRFKREHA